MAAEDDERKKLREQLFGDDDEEEDEEEEQLEEQAPVDPKADRGSKLRELAARKAAEKREAEERQRKASGRGGEREEVGEEGGEPAARRNYDSEDDQEGQATVEDNTFIDDEDDMRAQLFGSDNESDEEGEDVGEAPQAEEAEEDDGEMDDGDEFERIQKDAKAKRKRKRPDDDDQLLTQEMDLFLSRMEVAWENDVQANQEKRPAIHKLKLTREMTEKLGQAHLQRKFLDHRDGLTLLTRWLEPLPDGSLPNINIRAAILKLLLQMPIQVEDPDRRAQLKNSRIGRVVMFLSKLPEETTSNRRMAKELVERWSRPIFSLESKHAHKITEDRVRQNAQEVEEEVRAGLDEQLDEDGNPIQKKGPAPGERGWRWHASIPKTSKLDYKVRPEPKFSKEVMGQKGDVKAKHDKLDRKIKGMKVKNKKGRVDGPVKISVEGRGLLQ